MFPAPLRRLLAAVMFVWLAASACGADDPADSPGDARFPDVIEVVSELDDGLWTFSVTISSPYDSPERYADAWRVLGPDGTEYGFRLLTHDHANEQPFTRSQSGISIPDDVGTVTIQGRDLVNGWGGGTLDHDLQR